MESNTNKDDLLAEFLVVETLVKENPCGMSHGVLEGLRLVLNDFIGKHCVEGASREQVARYFGKDVRTITRWKNDYSDFPQPRHDGHREICYNWVDVIRWKLSHSELF